VPKYKRKRRLVVDKRKEEREENKNRKLRREVERETKGHNHKSRF
jgi:hypothetical protein